jgi:hypothetical protein
MGVQQIVRRHGFDIKTPSRMSEVHVIPAMLSRSGDSTAMHFDALPINALARVDDASSFAAVASPFSLICVD